MSLRASAVPRVTSSGARYAMVPSSICPLAVFAAMLVLGFSINVLTMFGMVLAIGLLVDDAIVVVENVERVMAEEGLSPKQATRKSMSQITGALIGIAMVLAAVFIPMAFFGGSTGVIYRQFSITIVSSMVLSVIVALVVGVIVLTGLLVERLGITSGPLAFIGSADLEFAGFAIVGLFVLSWIVALAIWRFGRIEQRWAARA